MNDVWIAVFLVCSVLLLAFPQHVRRLMGWWYGFSRRDHPMPDWYKRKWSDNYIRAFGLLALVVSLIGLFLRLSGRLDP